MGIKMEGVRDYSEDYPVSLTYVEGRPVVEAKNEGGYNGTLVDLKDLIGWLVENGYFYLFYNYARQYEE